MILGSATSSSTSTGTTSQAATDGQKLSGDLNRFLTLLVTQLQNQDPLQPLDANQFTSQLVQFASVEQQIYQNANLEKLVAAQNTSQLSTSVGYIGHVVEAEGTSLPLQDGSAELNYTLAADAAKATLTIRNADGRAVYAQSLDTEAGAHSVTWNGQNINGQQLADGAYTFEVAAQDKTGSAVTVTQGFAGLVTGVASGTDGAVLQLGETELPLASVKTIKDRPATVAETD